MDIHQLRTFLAILEHGSFSRAAEALHLTQSTVSFHIKMLESQTGTRLLDRQGGRVRPTSNGLVLRRYAARIVGLRDQVLVRLRKVESLEEGEVTVGASTIPAEYLLPPALSAFCREHPAVDVRVLVSDSRRATAALLAEECDLALVGARTRDARIAFTPFAEDEIVLVGALPDAIPSGRVTARELRRMPLLIREEGSGTREAVADLLARNGVLMRSGAGRIEIGSTEALKRCALAGLGLAFISRRAVEEELTAGRLALVRVPGLTVRRTFYAARLRRRTLPAAARALVRVLLQQNR